MVIKVEIMAKPNRNFTFLVIMYMMTKNVKFLFGFAIISTFITIGMSVAGY